jgi:hypothetical protein
MSEFFAELADPHQRHHQEPQTSVGEARGHVGYLVSLDFDAALDPSLRCAVCGARQMFPVCDQDEPNFLCVDCHRCWHVELDGVTQVDPRGCLDCPFRPSCLALLTARTGWTEPVPRGG